MRAAQDEVDIASRLSHRVANQLKLGPAHLSDNNPLTKLHYGIRLYPWPGPTGV